MSDPHTILGVKPGDTLDAIKKAYRREAFKHHPDRNANDPTAAERFRRAAEAYESLTKPPKQQSFQQGWKPQGNPWDDIMRGQREAAAEDFRRAADAFDKKHARGFWEGIYDNFSWEHPPDTKEALSQQIEAVDRELDDLMRRMGECRKRRESLAQRYNEATEGRTRSRKAKSNA